MNRIFLNIFKALFSCIPLVIIQLLGILIGYIFHFINKKSKFLLVQNLTFSNLYKNKNDLSEAINKNISETGKTIMESFAIWASKEKRILNWVNEIKGEIVPSLVPAS